MFDLVNRAYDGELADELTKLREEGLTIDEITARFNSDGWVVSRETIRRWVLEHVAPNTEAS